MKARELKVGDWVSYKGDYYPITDSSDDDVITITNENNFEIFSASNLEPITLSSEILEKNGWKHHVDYGRHYYTKDNIDLCRFEHDGIVTYTFCYNHQAIKHISYVHELQNLLWALGLDDDLKL